jgi:hypothetical protein
MSLMSTTYKNDGQLETFIQANRNLIHQAVVLPYMVIIQIRKK